MPLYCTTIVNAYWVKIVLELLHPVLLINSLYFLIYFFYILLHFKNLFRKLGIVMSKHFNSFLYCWIFLFWYLILKWMITFQTKFLTIFYPIFINMRWRSLVCKEFFCKIKNTSNIIVRSPKILIFINRVFQVLNLIFHYFYLLFNLWTFVLVLIKKSINRNDFMKLNLVFMFNNLLILVVHSIKLKAKHFCRNFNEFSLNCLNGFMIYIFLILEIFYYTWHLTFPCSVNIFESNYPYYSCCKKL